MAVKGIMTVRLTLLLGAALLLSACGAFRSQEAAEEHKAFGSGKQPPAGNGVNLHANIAAPSIPPDLAARANGLGRSKAADSQLYQYTVEVKAKKAELAETFEKVNRLTQMQDSPAQMATLEQRLAVSLGEGQDILYSFGYYEGTVAGKIEPSGGDKVKVLVAFTNGPRYKMGSSRVVVSSPLDKSNEAKEPPQSLADVGLAQGAPALADDVLAAVERVEEAFRDRGYPRAEVEGTRYIIDRSKKTLEAEIHINPGPFARMGEVIRPDDASVDQAYLNALRPWEIGQPWKQSLLDSYLVSLRQTGLFQKVEGFAAHEDGGAGELQAVKLTLGKAPERTVGGLLSYDTDFGPGISAYWEHRNFSGHGDRLRLDMPLWKDQQELTASYRYPYFLRPDQDIIARGGFLHQDTDAYELTSAAAAAGVERRLSRRWRASLMGAVEGGSLKDPGQKSQGFIMFGLPATVAYDSTNDLLDPTRGLRLMVLGAPYTGTFHEDFNVVRSKVEGHGFVPLGSEKLVLAAKMTVGALWGADNSQDVPSSLRFYSGGGGSVRGYEYQSIGPRNAKNDPLGGVSQVEMSAETRWRFSENMGIVAFADGGMVYENVDDKLFQNMLWGAGLGFRYYTPIGPARVDVAFPLDRREDDSAWQLYISLGQSF